MATTLTPALRRQLELDIAAIDRGGVPIHRPSALPEPSMGFPMDEAGEGYPGFPGDAEDTSVAIPTDPEPFARWLLAQRDRGDWIDNLADAARRDPGFPKNGDIVAVHARLILQGAEGDVFEQLDDAERCWRSL